VALKRMHAADDVRNRSRLRREALIGASLTHPNLVSIFDILTTEDGQDVIVMEYVEGQTLASALRGGNLDVRRTLEILTGASAALDAIHAQRIVHRDVKNSGGGSRILLSPSGCPPVLERVGSGRPGAPQPVARVRKLSVRSGRRPFDHVQPCRVVSRSGNGASVAIRTTSVRDNGTQHCSGTVDLLRGNSFSWLLHQIHITCV
jgi:serine/threonine protein kinase